MLSRTGTTAEFERPPKPCDMADGGGALLCYTVKVDGMCQRNIHIKDRTHRLPAAPSIEMKKADWFFLLHGRQAKKQQVA